MVELPAELGQRGGVLREGARRADVERDEHGEALYTEAQKEVYEMEQAARILAEATQP